MQREKVFSIITIVCFASIIFIPIGLVLMFYFTDWKKKKKIIIAAITTVLYIGIFVVIMNLHPSYNTSGISLPGNYDKGGTEFETNMSGTKTSEDMELMEGRGQLPAEDIDNLDRLPKTIKKENNKKNTRWVMPVLFFLVMLILIIIQNIRSSKNKTGYDNPYVDVTKYKLPLEKGCKFPMVHFLHLTPRPDEKFLYATETTQKDNEGNFVVTNQRVVIFNKENTVSYKLRELTIVVSITDNVLQVVAGEEKNFIFLPDNQMKYALAVLRYAYENFSGK